MSLSSTTNDIGGAAESAYENFAALMSWDELTRWFELGGLRDQERKPSEDLRDKRRKTECTGTPALPRNWPRSKKQRLRS